MDKDVISPPSHSAFTTPIELIKFVQKLRDLSGGKPIGFKLCIGKKREFMAICKAIVEAHEGSIHARSGAGKGTTFTVRFPLGSQADSPAEEEP